jgi:hypothetical protein
MALPLPARGDCVAGEVPWPYESFRRRPTRLDGRPRGNLVTESYVNPHLHLCKVWTLPMMEEEALKTCQGAAVGKAMAGQPLARRCAERRSMGSRSTVRRR